MFRVSFLFVLAFATLISCKDASKVSVIVEVEGVPDSATAFITGNSDALGNWNPSQVELIKDDSFHVVHFTLDTSEVVEFKITLGSWETEGRLGDGSAPPNVSFKADKDTIIHLRYSSWTAPPVESTVVGVLDIIELPFPNEDFPTRKIRVWRPYAADYKRYRTLYMADGQNLFDAATANMGEEWKIDESMKELKDYNMSIVVGIDNSPLRMKEYLDTPEGEVYRKWVVEVVVPYVDEHYSTIPGAFNRLLGGSSAGGTVSLLLHRRESKTFGGGALCFSPAVYYQGEETQIDLIPSFRSSNKAPIYFDMGGLGVDSVLKPGLDMLTDSLDAFGWTEDNKWYKYEYFPEDDHNEMAWRGRFKDAYTWYNQTLKVYMKAVHFTNAAEDNH
ncbi:alpha/beta hydrolase-fold protein [Phaeocystidibacter luteus]|uniref:CBM20 domain-containing protein n=1 Tax=Phaeocystidibacter luteus TaxID=911197 RepID=A0A6N6RMB2_9FLAO|nr:alpha/beta hydrolase-fold protein [Phaeocystidibacter luteus]KAB2814717.1 hypothetical protein F8C67_02940 [Phaeocystidibacter luteus]